MARILIVEDNAVNQKLMQAILRSVGHESVVAVNGQLGLEALEESHFDLVLMDLMMPVMDGYEATRRIRQNPKWRDLPVVAVTANNMLGSRERALTVGCNAFLAKPYTKQQLLEALDQWLRGSSDMHPIADPD